MRGSVCGERGPVALAGGGQWWTLSCERRSPGCPPSPSPPNSPCLTSTLYPLSHASLQELKEIHNRQQRQKQKEAESGVELLKEAESGAEIPEKGTVDSQEARFVHPPPFVI